MTQICCPDCRLRFTGAAAAYLAACPQCAELLQPIPSAEAIIGFRRFSHDEFPYTVPTAVAIALPSPAPDVKPA
jgi:hypothetical protein